MSGTDFAGAQRSVGDGQRSSVRTNTVTDFRGHRIHFYVQNRCSGQVSMRTRVQSGRRTDKQLRRHRIVDRRDTAMRL